MIVLIYGIYHEIQDKILFVVGSYKEHVSFGYQLGVDFLGRNILAVIESMLLGNVFDIIYRRS